MMEKSTSQKRVKLEKKKEDEEPTGEKSQQSETGTGGKQLIRSPITKPYLAPEVK